MGGDFSVKLTRVAFTQNPQPFPTSEGLWAARQKILSPEDIELRRSKLGELCWSATVSQPDIRARLQRITTRANFLRGGDIATRADDLVKTVKARQHSAPLRYSSSSNPGAPARGDADGRIRSRGDTIYCGTLPLVGWSGAAYGDKSAEGKPRSGYVIGLMSSTPKGPCRILQWTSKVTRKLVENSLGGEVYALSEMVDHKSMSREFYAHSAHLSLGMIRFEDCDSLFYSSKEKEAHF